MRVHDEQSLETTSKVINAEFQKARWCLRPDANNNDTNNNELLAGDAIDRSSIKSFYRNACILVTGGTGFVGKVLLEKLLRTCDSLQCIYVLLRSKRGLSSEERYHELIQNPVNDNSLTFSSTVLQLTPSKALAFEMQWKITDAQS